MACANSCSPLLGAGSAGAGTGSFATGSLTAGRVGACGLAAPDASFDAGAFGALVSSTACDAQPAHASANNNAPVRAHRSARIALFELVLDAQVGIGEHVNGFAVSRKRRVANLDRVPARRELELVQRRRHAALAAVDEHFAPRRHGERDA